MLKLKYTLPLLTTLILPSIFATAQENDAKGELHLYNRPTQIGTAANREFTDDKGRIYKIIYYTSLTGLEAAVREDQLRVQSISKFTYDDNNCQIKQETFSAEMKLLRVNDVKCFEGTSTPSLTISSDARGVKQMETRHSTSGSTKTSFYFADDGKKITGINGQLPTDIDLTNGWGEEFSGFACSIAANRERGRQQDLQIHVTIKNLHQEKSYNVMISPIDVELKDSSGRFVAHRDSYERTEPAKLRDGCPIYLDQGAPQIGHAQLQAGLELGTNYDQLAPGKYSLRISYCLSGVSGYLVSNTIFLQVEADN